MTSSSNDATSRSIKRRFKLLNQFLPVTMIASTTTGTYNPRISAQTVTNRLREIGEKHPYTMYVLYAAFLFWPSIYRNDSTFLKKTIIQCGPKSDCISI